MNEDTERSELCSAVFGKVTKIEFLKISEGPETFYLDNGAIITFPKGTFDFQTPRPYEMNISDTVRKALNK